MTFLITTPSLNSISSLRRQTVYNDILATLFAYLLLLSQCNSITRTLRWPGFFIIGLFTTKQDCLGIECVWSIKVDVLSWDGVMKLTVREHPLRPARNIFKFLYSWSLSIKLPYTSSSRNSRGHTQCQNNRAVNIPASHSIWSCPIETDFNLQPDEFQ